MFEIPADGRRFRALEKRLAKVSPVPCVEGQRAKQAKLEADNRTSFAPETVRTKRNKRDRIQTKRQQNQRT